MRKRTGVTALLVCAVVLLMVSFQREVSPVTPPVVAPVSPSPESSVKEDDDEQIGALDEAGAEITPEPVPIESVCDTVRRGQSFYSIMSDYGFSPSVITKLVSAFAGVFDCRKISSGDEYHIVTDQDGNLVRFTIRTSPVDIFSLSHDEGQFLATKEEVTVEKKIRKVSGVVDHSLFGAIAAAKEKDQLAIQFADIFAWDIDFRYDLREGDQFTIIFEKYYKDGSFIRYGKILAAEYRNDKRTHQAVYYQDSECREDYFTPSGRSLRRSFMRSPLRFTRISSGYSRQRLHPILRKYRPHLGVDFAAPTGTPVWAVGDGVVIYKGWKNGNGNTVSIRHPNGYETMYNHLSRYGKGIKKGKHVRQKDIIGYVGSTGLSTGPHLDYRMSKNGRFINPLKEKFPLGTPVPAASREAFQQLSKEMLALLGDEYDAGALVAVKSGAGGQGSGDSK